MRSRIFFVVAICNRKTANSESTGQKTESEAGRCGKASQENYVMLTSVYVPYTCRSASQISPTVA